MNLQRRVSRLGFFNRNLQTPCRFSYFDSFKKFLRFRMQCIFETLRSSFSLLRSKKRRRCFCGWKKAKLFFLVRKLLNFSIFFHSAVQQRFLFISNPDISSSQGFLLEFFTMAKQIFPKRSKCVNFVRYSVPVY